MAKLKRKDLTPNQMRRANITTAITVSFVYLFYILIMISSKITETSMKIVFVIVLALLYIATAAMVQKNLRNKTGELAISIGFLIGFAIIAFTQPPASMMLIFPVFLTLSVYLNEKLMAWGSGLTFVILIVKYIMISQSGIGEEAIKESQNITNLVFICILISLFGGCKAVSRLIEFSNEETNAVADKADKQMEVAREVETIVQDVSNQFSEIQDNLSSISTTIDNTHTTMNFIADGSSNSAEETQRQAEMTNQIQERLERTSATTDEALETTAKLQQIVQTGTAESDELARQSVIVDESTAQISATIGRLAEHVDKVSGITDSILSISSQTNLLALNASIEAARAGEAGKGFAVVADEIRQLAEMTKVSTEQITQIMTELIAITEETKSELSNSIESIDVQREKVKAVHESFKVVGEDMNHLVESMNIMGSEVNEVLNANQIIVDGINTLTGISEEISASTASSKEDMDNLADSITMFSEEIDKTFDSLECLKEVSRIEETEEE